MVKKSKKVIITVAPVCHTEKPVPEGCRNPLTPEAVANEIISCARAGASMVHLHTRDDRGLQTSDLKHFSKTLDLFSAETDIVIQGSTGGLADLSLEERCTCLNEPKVEVASLNMGSVNFGEGVYINTLPDIRYWAKRMKETDVMPELECFDLSMIETSLNMAREGILDSPLHFNFCFNIKGALSANLKTLACLSALVENESHWGVTCDSMQDLSFLAGAVSMGASVIRVGFEDSFYYGPGRIATSNTRLVEEAAGMVTSLGFELATPEEARNMLGL